MKEIIQKIHWNKFRAIWFASIVVLILFATVLYRGIQKDPKLSTLLDKDVYDDDLYHSNRARQFDPNRTSLAKFGTFTDKEEYVDVQCVDYADKQYTETKQIKCRSYNVQITRVSETVLNVFIEKAGNHDNLVLIWFNDSIVNTVIDYELTTQDINCVIADTENISVTNLAQDTTYTFCVFQSNELTVSPFDCIGYYLWPMDDDSLQNPEDTVWISNDDKTSAILAACGIFVVCLWFGLLLGVCLIRRYPNWLRGTKNVVIVEGRNGKKPKRRSNSIDFYSEGNLRDYRVYLESRRNSTSDIKGYEIALNPSRFDIVKARLENYDSKSQYEAKYYLEKMPNAPAPPPPTYGETNANENHVEKDPCNQYEKILDSFYEKNKCATKEDKIENLYAKFNSTKQKTNQKMSN